MSAPRSPLHVVILAGGGGERLWPRSRMRRPKPLLRLAGGDSLLEATLARAARVAPPERTWIVCGRAHAPAVRAASGLPARQLLVEPRRRNTAPAVAWAARRVAAEDPEAVLAVLPADHLVPQAAAFAVALRTAARAARNADVLVTLGVRPTRPETGYGYIRLGKSVGKSHKNLYRVRRFVEKPGRAAAQRYLRTGNNLWNAGIFVWKAQAILEEIEAHAPRVHRAFVGLGRRASGRGPGAAALDAAYRRAPGVSIDNAVLEHSGRVWCLPVSFPWSDVGTWGSLAEALGGGEETRVVAGEAICRDAPANLVWGEANRPVALLGVSGLAVIDAGDALLVAPLERSGEVRELVARLRATGRSDLI